MVVAFVLTRSDIGMLDVAFQRFQLNPDNFEGGHQMPDQILVFRAAFKRLEYNRYSFKDGYQLAEYERPSSCPHHHFEYELLNRHLQTCNNMINDESVSSLPDFYLEMYRELFRSEPTVVHSMEPLRDFLLFSDYMHLMSEHLKQKLETLKPTSRVAWIVKLLLNFHCGNECTRFMTLAVKFTLKALELSRYCFTINYMDANKIFVGFLKVLQKNKCVGQVVADALKVLHVLHKMTFSYLLHMNGCMKYVWNNSDGTDMNLRYFFDHTTPFARENLLRCFDSFSDSFVTLTEHGAAILYNPEDFAKGSDSRSLDGEELLNQLDDMRVSLMNRIEFRRRQVRNHLCNQCNSNRKHAEKSFIEELYGLPLDITDRELCSCLEYSFKLLWASIPDPFLTEEDFMGESCQDQNPDKTKLQWGQPWRVYKKIILNGHSPLKSPRSLQHLARYAIRQCMARNLQLPKGVPTLRIPDLLKDFVLLKDCGENPNKEYVRIRDELWLCSNSTY